MNGRLGYVIRMSKAEPPPAQASWWPAFHDSRNGFFLEESWLPIVRKDENVIMRTYVPDLQRFSNRKASVAQRLPTQSRPRGVPAMNARRSFVVSSMLLAGAAIGLAPAGAEAQSSDQMQWSITPYVWASNTAVDLSFRDRDVGSQDISFRDLVDVMDAAFMVHVEGGKGHWSGFVDYTYLQISDRDKRNLLNVDSASTQVYLDAAMAYWPGGPGSNLNLYGGVRYTGLDDEFKIKRASDGTLVRRLGSDKKFTDALLGVRYRWDLSSRWSFLAQADGSFGSSEGTWLLRGLFGYTVGERQMNRILFGYQYKEADFEDGDLGLDYSFDGPLAGFSFRF